MQERTRHGRSESMVSGTKATVTAARDRRASADPSASRIDVTAI
ncbi:hypothetical protein BUH_3470 [Burkholderia pseudomallei Pakistan 9]|nr:hypothetical protein BUH_3470 [Burkholderia pseudomallei Pakistan 9]